ncbi:MAG TPA: ABC transporter permease [Thermoanaerobaculia bacterium]|nr:ABC transporter permease [Thermoanaerobaculia bacterium]
MKGGNGLRRLATGGRPAFLAAVLLCVLWEVWAHGRSSSTILFPPPSVIGATLAKQALSGELLRTVAATLRRLALGVVLGGVPALLLGLVMGFSAKVRAAVDPVVAAAHSIPKIAVLPILMILLGIGEAPKIVVVAAAAFFPLLINTMAGVRQISPIHFEVAHSYGASAPRVFWRVLLPGSLPQILSGARLALNGGLLITIALEIVAARTGLGAAIWLAWQTLRVEELFAALFIASLLGIGFNAALVRLERLLVPWHSAPEI